MVTGSHTAEDDACVFMWVACSARASLAYTHRVLPHLLIGVILGASSCELREAEVAQPDVPAGVEEQVVGVEVPVDDAL
jgi:hypothetical protein